MLLEFCVENFGPFKDETCLDMMATATKGLEDNLIELPSVRARKKPLHVNKAVAIYGANASGKSSLINAMSFMYGFVVDSAKKYDSGDEIEIHPFLMDKTSSNSPSFFEVVFMISSTKYRYGFELNSKEVLSEWLYYSPKGIERTVFTRDKQNFEFPKGSKDIKKVTQFVRNNSLVISVASQMNIESATNVVNWFKSFMMYTPVHDDTTRQLLGDICKGETVSILSEFLTYADTGIDSFDRIEVNSEEDVMKMLGNDKVDDKTREVLEVLKTGKSGFYRLDFKHPVYDEENTKTSEVSFGLELESIGTQKFLALMALTVTALIHGGIVIVDELDASLHPSLAAAFIKIFQRVCSGRAQLIFTTHNTHLLRSHCLRRDQIWLTEKDRYGRAELSCVSDYKVRKNADVGKLYMNGRFGGIPVLASSKIDRMINKLCEIATRQQEVEQNHGEA
ncbi:ATP-binding protein [Pseudodesulfovibrio sp.]|nr:ATP-binding protein [Pseudodesulfovibrio sp.]